MHWKMVSNAKYYLKICPGWENKIKNMITPVFSKMLGAFSSDVVPLLAMNSLYLVDMPFKTLSSVSTHLVIYFLLLCHGC